MKNIVDRLNEKITRLESPIVVGLDPVLSNIPTCYKAIWRWQKINSKKYQIL